MRRRDEWQLPRRQRYSLRQQRLDYLEMKLRRPRMQPSRCPRKWNSSSFTFRIEFNWMMVVYACTGAPDAKLLFKIELTIAALVDAHARTINLLNCVLVYFFRMLGDCCGCSCRGKTFYKFVVIGRGFVLICFEPSLCLQNGALSQFQKTYWIFEHFEKMLQNDRMMLRITFEFEVRIHYTRWSDAWNWLLIYNIKNKWDYQ